MNADSLGIDRHGLDASFDADEALKSNLIVEAQLLSFQQQPDAAADRFAQAAKMKSASARVTWTRVCGKRVGSIFSAQLVAGRARAISIQP